MSPVPTPAHASAASREDADAALKHEIAAYVEGAVALTKLGVPDICFGRLEGHGRLVLDGLEEPARYVRISTEGEGVLHLKAISVLGGPNGKAANIGKGAEITYSSVYPGTEELAKRDLFLANHSAAYAFHTKRDDPAWVQLKLPSDAVIRKIEVLNRTDRYIERAWNIEITVSEDGENWRRIYSHKATVERLRNLLRHRSRHTQSTLPSPIRDCIDDILAHLMLGENTEASARLREQRGMGAATKKTVSAAFNTAVLLNQDQEWTNHGVKRTFRFWSEKDKQEYLTFAMQTVHLVAEMGYESCIGYGGVLSMVRDHDLIPHDDDLDILIACPRDKFSTVGDFMQSVTSALSEVGYKIAGDYLTHRHGSKNSRAIDLFFGFEEADFVNFFPGPRSVLRKEDMFPPLTRSFIGVPCAIPRNPFRYVEVVYGEHWRSPSPGWNHTWDRTEYADWL